MADTRIHPQEIDGYDQAEPLDAFEPDAGRTARMEAALEQLRIEHLPFRRAAPEALRELEDLRTAVVEQVTSDPSLVRYYKEAWTGVKTKVAVPKMALRRIALLQLQLMERAFYLLQLHRYGNAPENAGWMELFRRWGASPHFNTVFDEVDSTLTPDFTAFYLTYFRTSLPHVSAGRLWDEDRGREPLIQHPWLEPDADRGRGAFMDSGLVEASLEKASLEIPNRPGAGGQIDPKGGPEADQTYKVPSANSDSGASPPEESGNE